VGSIEDTAWIPQQASQSATKKSAFCQEERRTDAGRRGGKKKKNTLFSTRAKAGKKKKYGDSNEVKSSKIRGTTGNKAIRKQDHEDHSGNRTKRTSALRQKNKEGKSTRTVPRN